MSLNPLFYSIGGLSVYVEGEDSLSLLESMPAMQPFREAKNDYCTLHWCLDAEVPPPTVPLSCSMSISGLDFCIYVDDEGVLCEQTESVPRRVAFRIRYDIHNAVVKMSSVPKPFFHFALWLAYNMQASSQGRFALHAASVVFDGRASLFLGESGTGKSTHARQWMAAFDGCQLLNDDSPVVSFENGVAFAYGSPWSGKTPCYRTDKFPLYGFARLNQALYNRAQRTDPVAAIAALVPSFPPMLVHVPLFCSRMLQLVDLLVSHVPILRLDCLPNVEAAYCCRKEMENCWQ